MNPAGYTTATLDLPPLDFDAMLQDVKQLQAQREQVDASMAKAIRDYIDRSGISITVWAARLGVGVEELLGVMRRGEPISGRLYDAIRRAFVPGVTPVG